MEENEILDEVILITDELQAKIEKNIAKLKEENPNVRKIVALVVEGDVESGEKELYVGYFRQPDLKSFSKFLTATSSNPVVASRTLAKECFMDGDKEMVDDESLFLFGTNAQFTKVISSRNGRLVNLSKTRK